jgi:hypothetical protein
MLQAAIRYHEPVLRPPSEARSLVLQLPRDRAGAIALIGEVLATRDGSRLMTREARRPGPGSGPVGG